MKFQPATLNGLWLITLEPRIDDRGSFVRTYCEREFAARGLNTRWPQSNLTSTRARGAVRGLHFQVAPHPETKLVRCLRGAIYDVVVDLRPDSPTYAQWEAFELAAGSHLSLYIGPGFAHGFQTLEHDSEVSYQMSDFYFPELARGVRWDDPALDIPWPLPLAAISERDQKLPLLAELEELFDRPKISGFTKNLD